MLKEILENPNAPLDVKLDAIANEISELRKLIEDKPKSIFDKLKGK